VEALFEALDLFIYAAAVVGGLLAILWIYNSTIKERRGILRRASKAGDPALGRFVKKGILLQRLGFSAAAVATGIVILLFARGYYQKYDVNIAPAYIVLAMALVALGSAGALLSYLFRDKE
jgi:hypothetical protein